MGLELSEVTGHVRAARRGQASLKHPVTCSDDVHALFEFSSYIRLLGPNCDDWRSFEATRCPIP